MRFQNGKKKTQKGNNNLCFILGQSQTCLKAIATTAGLCNPHAAIINCDSFSKLAFHILKHKCSKKNSFYRLKMFKIIMNGYECCVGSCVLLNL